VFEVCGAGIKRARKEAHTFCLSRRGGLPLKNSGRVQGPGCRVQGRIQEFEVRVWV